jgi:hypothetical protein
MTDIVERLQISAQRSNLNTEAADEIEALREQRDELLALVKGAVGGIVYLSEKAGIHQAEWAAWDRWARAAIASVKGETK